MPLVSQLPVTFGYSSNPGLRTPLQTGAGNRRWKGRDPPPIMNALDIVIVVILAYCLIRGIFRGLVKELSAIVGVLAGFYAAYTYYPLAASLASRWISDPAIRSVLSFFVLFAAVFVLVSLLGVLIQRLLRMVFLGWVDRICGGGFGAVKGLLISAVVVVALTAFLQKGTPLVRDSLLSPYVTVVSERLAKIVSQEMKQQFTVKAAYLKDNWEGQP